MSFVVDMLLVISLAAIVLWLVRRDQRQQLALRTMATELRAADGRLARHEQEIGALAQQLRGRPEQPPPRPARPWVPPDEPELARQIRFIGLPIVDLTPGLHPTTSPLGRPAAPDLRHCGACVGLGESADEPAPAFERQIQAFASDPDVGSVRALVLGPWTTTDAWLPTLTALSPRLTDLEAAFIGDIVGEERELRAIAQGDHGPLLSGLPSVRTWIVRGANGLRFTDLRQRNLETLIIQCSTFPADAFDDLLDAELPALRALVLWLGPRSTVTQEQLRRLLSAKSLPSLDHLGLKYGPTDAIASQLGGSPILRQLRGLDLSMGRLTDVGAEALLACPELQRLQLLNLRHHRLSPATVARIVASGVPADLTSPAEPARAE